MKYGILDVRDNVWLGNDGGPALFEPPDYDLAIIARDVARIRLGLADYPVGRLIVTEFVEAPVRLRDTITTPITTSRALRFLEGK